MDPIPIAERLARIEGKLLEAARRKLAPRGSENPGFELKPPADEREIREFERVCEVTLPSEYRAFITTLGDGGAGPGYGLLPLASGLEDVTPELLRTPFAFTAFTDALHLLDRKTDEYQPRTGSITISTEGCGILHFIVIAGPTRGQMWIDHRTTDSGYWPLAVGFLDWYERSLDDTLQGGNGIWWRDFRPRGYESRRK